MLLTICSRFLKVAGVAALLLGGVAVFLGVSAWRGDPLPPPGQGEEIDVTADTVVFSFANVAGPLKRLTAMKKILERQPDDAQTAAQYAELALQHYARSGDARFLGYASGALSHWQSASRPPGPLWLLRGRLAQTQHRFAEAAADLDRFLAQNRDSVEAALLAADAWRRAGDIERSRAHCARLAVMGRGDLARYCAADILLSLGETERAAAAVASIDRDLPNLEAATARWALAVAAEAMTAAGRHTRAGELYQQALATGDPVISLTVAYADLLLEMERPADALTLLSDQPDTDAVLIRRAVAARALGDPRFAAWRRRLAESFAAAAMLGGDDLHLRERALYELRVAADAGSALAFATENWQRQKGFEDASLLRQAAQAAGRPEAARAIDDWRAGFVRLNADAG